MHIRQMAYIHGHPIAITYYKNFFVTKVALTTTPVLVVGVTWKTQSDVPNASALITIVFTVPALVMV